MRTWFRSLEGSLAVRLGLLYLIATAMAVGALWYEAYDTAGTLNDRDLSLRARDLARYVVPGPDQAPRLSFPPSWRRPTRPALPTFMPFVPNRAK